jgi:hypothetical protein
MYGIECDWMWLNVIECYWMLLNLLILSTSIILSRPKPTRVHRSTVIFGEIFGYTDFSWKWSIYSIKEHIEWSLWFILTASIDCLLIPHFIMMCLFWNLKSNLILKLSIWHETRNASTRSDPIWSDPIQVLDFVIFAIMSDYSLNSFTANDCL